VRVLPQLLSAALLAATTVSPGDAQGLPAYSVGPQYGSTHVYVAPANVSRFVASFIATFGGVASQQGVFQVTPTPSQAVSQLALTPAGTVSVFGFKTAVPYPFGIERTGYLVSDMDKAVASAVAAGATRLVETYPDRIGRDALVLWPGGVGMQLYWHKAKPSYAALATVPENRIYLTADSADAFIASWTRFSGALVVSDNRAARGLEIGKPGTTYRRIRLTSGFGRMVVLVSDGALPWPYGRDISGYEVADLSATLVKAKAAHAEILVQPYQSDGRRAAIIRFPGGYIAELHALSTAR
jgi:hypothetical protein